MKIELQDLLSYYSIMFPLMLNVSSTRGLKIHLY